MVSGPLTVSQVNSRRFSIDCQVVYKGMESLFFRLKILFNWKVIVVEVAVPGK